MGVMFVYTNKDKGRRAPIFPFSLSAEKRIPSYAENHRKKVSAFPKKVVDKLIYLCYNIFENKVRNKPLNRNKKIKYKGESIMERKYAALFLKEDKGYSVFLADYDQATCGETLEEARSMAKELVELSAYSEGHKAAEDINSVDIQALYKERTGLELGKAELRNAQLEYVEVAEDVNSYGVVEFS